MWCKTRSVISESEKQVSSKLRATFEEYYGTREVSGGVCAANVIKTKGGYRYYKINPCELYDLLVKDEVIEKGCDDLLGDDSVCLIQDDAEPPPSVLGLESPLKEWATQPSII